MNIYLKNITRIIFLCSSSFLFLSSTAINAAECGILKLQSNRSSGVTVQKNDCSELPAVSSNSIFELSPKGRLWLKSNEVKANNADFQLICQNKTADSIQIEFSASQSPWLNHSKLNNCSGWTNNKLTCDGNKGEKRGLYCVLSLAKVAKKSTQVERTTSVKMRGLNSFIETKDIDKHTSQQILAEINPELKLCKELNQYTMDAKISWNVEQNSGKQNINIISTSGLNTASLSECVKTVISTFSYPQLSKKISFNSTF